ncbi:protein PPP4R3C [Cricetulus griseus]|nr:protein PPP4R3C [Cricetulus griseus]XP_027288507.1 protein PPP4R3C [Cricetulus griseus]XP_027288508.1 protein PPP4R3C [Cricetulus griseus]XP_035305875.1 protein PPP4R3C [Cricetulus griseus]ERE65898.1 putative SMEK-like protein [Cricetulus griseus]
MWPRKSRSQTRPRDRFHRVKVYILKDDEKWEHLGSGRISTKYIGRLQGVCLIVHSKSNDSLIMESIIYPDVSYRKVKRNLIIWTEPNNRTMAIRFRNPEGCQDTWGDICQVQGKDPSVRITQELTDLDVFQLPEIQNLCEMRTCENSTLENIAHLFNFVQDSPSYKERLAFLLEKEDYIKNLLQIFHICEDQQNIEGLYFLYFIIKGILFLNNMRLYEIMFSDECIMDVLGCLEYDPVLAQPYRYREFLTENAKFKEVMPITCSELRQKIDQTYRMQYIHGILFPTQSKLQQHHLSDLKDFIFYNKIEIVTMLQKDDKFLFDVFAQLKDNTLGHERRLELLLFFKEFCAFAKILNSQKKEKLLKTLIKLGLMSVLKFSVHMQDYQTKEAAIDIFTYLVEYNPQIIRVYVMEEEQISENDDDLLINIMIKQIICDPDPESSYVLSLTAVLRALLDPERMRITANGSEKSKFMNFFSTHCMNILAAPILSIIGQSDSDDNRANICLDNYQNAQLLGVVLDLLSFCVKHHTTYIGNFVLDNNLLSRVLVLLSSKHKFLVLCAIRFMRQMIGLNDEIYNFYIIRKNLFEPVVNAFLHNGTQNNMLNSAIMELFEFIREENIKSLIVNIAENFFMAFESVVCVQTFKGLKVNFEEEKERESEVRRNLRNIINQTIYCRHMKAMEVKVKKEICSEESTAVIIPMGSDFPNRYDVFIRIKDASENEVELPERKASEAFECSSSNSDASANRKSEPHYSNKFPLVDYSDDDDENKKKNEDYHDIVEEEEPPPKRHKLGS